MTGAAALSHRAARYHAQMPPVPIFHKPRALRRGDPIAVVAPAGPFDRESFDAGVAIVASRYQVRYAPGIFERSRYLAGDDPRRLNELNQALADPDIRAIFCARGGYGAMRLLDRLQLPGEPKRDAGGPNGDAGDTADTENAGDAGEVEDAGAARRAARRIAKPLVGFSDITALHQWYQQHGLISIHGPVLTQLGRLGQSTHERLFSLLESASPAASLHGTETLVAGRAEGPLLGGNLSVFTRLLGTPFMPPLDGAILLLEDLAERPYRLDRMWTHLELAGVLRRIAGIVLGSFSGCEERDANYTSVDVLRDLAAKVGVPCAAGFPIGHGEYNEPVPLGARVRLDADTLTLTFLEPAVAV
jgi:muramoyltetrapeptide carboxypeptidase